MTTDMKADKAAETTEQICAVDCIEQAIAYGEMHQGSKGEQMQIAYSVLKEAIDHVKNKIEPF